MKNHPWAHAWKTKKFGIKTLTPSILVSRNVHKLSTEDWVLDVGSGNGRNSIYLASLGINVDSFDVENLIDWNTLADAPRDRIQFKTSTVLNYFYPDNKYKGVIVTRVIQYLNLEELDFLLKKIMQCIKKDGFLLLSYNTKGGIFSREDIDVPKHIHKIDRVKRLLEKYFGDVVIEKGSSKSVHVNYSGDIKTFDIYASGIKK